jgi:hypothetical protein
MEPQRSSLSFDASLPGIIHSFEACDSVEQFPDMALARLGALFGADLVNFFQCGRDNKGNLNDFPADAVRIIGRGGSLPCGYAGPGTA